MTDLTLYTAEVCPYAQRTRILLGEKSIAHETVELDFDAKPGWFLDMTPNGRVPVIRHGDLVLWESATINEYLDASCDGPSLSPTDERVRATMRNEIRHFDSVFLPLVYKLLFEQQPAAQSELRAQLERELDFLEERLAQNQTVSRGVYWMGTGPSLADIAMFPFFERFEVFDHYRALKLPGRCTRLHAWYDTLVARPAFAATMHDLDWFVPRYAQYASGTAQGLSAQAFRSGALN